MPRPAIISARPPEMRSTVAKSSNTVTGSAVLRMVTALAKRNPLRCRRHRRQHDSRRGNSHIQPMMFANRKNVETQCVSKLCCSEDLRQPLLGVNCLASLHVRREISEGVKLRRNYPP